MPTYVTRQPYPCQASFNFEFLSCNNCHKLKVMHTYLEDIHRNGFAIVEDVIPPQSVSALALALERLPESDSVRSRNQADAPEHRRRSAARGPVLPLTRAAAQRLRSFLGGLPNRHRQTARLHARCRLCPADTTARTVL